MWWLNTKIRLNDWIANTFFNSTHAVSSHREQLVLLHDWLVVLPPKKCLSVGIITISNGDNNLNNLVMMKLGDEKYILYITVVITDVRASSNGQFGCPKCSMSPSWSVTRRLLQQLSDVQSLFFFGSSRSILAGHYCLRSARELNSHGECWSLVQW